MQIAGWINLVYFCRSLVSKLRRLEKKTHQVQSKLGEDPSNFELLKEEESLEQQVKVPLFEVKAWFVMWSFEGLRLQGAADGAERGAERHHLVL